MVCVRERGLCLRGQRGHCMVCLREVSGHCIVQRGQCIVCVSMVTASLHQRDHCMVCIREVTVVLVGLERSLQTVSRVREVTAGLC